MEEVLKIQFLTEGNQEDGRENNLFKFLVPRYFEWLVCLINRRERKERMGKQDCSLRSLRSLRLISSCFQPSKIATNHK
jgi:hypothetical protein